MDFSEISGLEKANYCTESQPLNVLQELRQLYC